MTSATEPEHERCQRIIGVDGTICPNQVEWVGDLHLSRCAFVVKTCDLHRSALVDAEPIDGNWEQRRFPTPSEATRPTGHPTGATATQ
jgi:hypothetical protein